MNQEGPTLEHLLRRLIETPSEFFAEPQNDSGSGIVSVIALANDLLDLHGYGIADFHSLVPDPSAAGHRRAGLAMLLCWFLADDGLIASHKIPLEALIGLLTNGAAELASQNEATRYRDDPERREEFARFALARMGLRPAGESLAQAQDRLTALSSIERNRVLLASREAEKRARAIREALARKAAQESADKYTRE